MYIDFGEFVEFYIPSRMKATKLPIACKIRENLVTVRWRILLLLSNGH